MRPCQRLRSHLLSQASATAIVFALCLTAGQAAAEDKPQVRFGFGAVAGDAKDLNAFVLRPNIEQDVYFFVYNPTKKDAKFKFVVAGLTAEVSVAAGGTERVSFAKPAPPPPPAAAPGAPPPAAEPKPAWIDLKESPPSLDVQLSEVGAAESPPEPLFPIRLARAESYLKEPVVNFDEKAGLLTVEIESKQTFVGKPCVVQMVLPLMRVQGRLLPLSRDALLRGELKKPGDKVKLYAKILKLGNPEKPEFHLSVDGDEDAFIFDTEFKLDGNVPPRSVEEGYRINAPRYAPEGDKLLVRIEANNVKLDRKLELAVGTGRDSSFEKTAAQELPSGRDIKVSMSPTGPNGSVLFKMAVKDWIKEVDIAGVRGQRTLRVRTLPEGKEREAIVTIDSTPPEDVAIVEPPATASLGAAVNFNAKGRDDLGIKEVVFFLGKPPADGKLPPTLEIYKAKMDAKGNWSAQVSMPADKKGPAVVSVQFVNNAGMSAFDSATVKVLDPNDPKAAALPGRIEGKVFEGDRPQANLEVVLKDDKGKDKDKAKSKEDGSFAFEDVAAGNYSVATSKEASVTKGESAVKVVSDKTAIVQVKLFR